MKKHYDVIIVGAGSMGMAAGYYLAKQHVSTLLVDAFDPPHTEGSHHGDTRIIRHAYGEGRGYVPLALRAQQLWDELEKETYHKIFTKTGVLSFGPKDESAFIDEAIESAKQYSLPIEILEATEVQKRWPGIALPGDYHAIFEPDSGVLFSENCIRAYRELALAHGATLLQNTPVEDVTIEDNIVSIHTDKGLFTANKLILSAGAWNNQLLHKLGINIPIEPRRQTIGWFEADESLFQSSTFPAFTAVSQLGMYYGFPSFGGSGVKIGRHDYGQQVDPDKVNREFGIYQEDESYTRTFLERYMPQASGDLKRGRVCMYTNTPDEHFVVDLHPSYKNVAIAAGFSGHGFKFASVIGEVLSQLVCDGDTEHDISLFSIRRPALQQPPQNS